MATVTASGLSGGAGGGSLGAAGSGCARGTSHRYATATAAAAPATEKKKVSAKPRRNPAPPDLPLLSKTFMHQ